MSKNSTVASVFSISEFLTLILQINHLISDCSNSDNFYYFIILVSSISSIANVFYDGNQFHDILYRLEVDKMTTSPLIFHFLKHPSDHFITGIQTWINTASRYFKMLSAFSWSNFGRILVKYGLFLV